MVVFIHLRIQRNKCTRDINNRQKKETKKKKKEEEQNRVSGYSPFTRLKQNVAIHFMGKCKQVILSDCASLHHIDVSLLSYTINEEKNQQIYSISTYVVVVTLCKSTFLWQSTMEIILCVNEKRKKSTS